MSQLESGPKDIVAPVNYVAADGTTRQPGIFKKPVHGVPSEHARAMKIHDIRPVVDNFKLDTNGFQFVKLPRKDTGRYFKEWGDESIPNEYYGEVAEVVKNLTGASTVHVFNHVLRQTADAPTGHPHVDYTGVAAHLEGTKAELGFPPAILARFNSSSRYAYINAWRPLRTVHRDALALADTLTVPDSDYQLRARKFPSGVESGNYIMSHGSKEDMHRWYYMPEMSPEDLVVFKGYDTLQEKVAWRCPHAAVVIEGTADLPPRESVECRAVCFWE